MVSKTTHFQTAYMEGIRSTRFLYRDKYPNLVAKITVHNSTETAHTLF